MFRRTVSTLAVVAAAVLTDIAQPHAQSAAQCGPRTELLKQLSSQYRENPVAVGVASNGTLLEVLASNDGATWTALVTRGNGFSCVVMSGEDWQARAPQVMANLSR